jgi:hypothetical protein
LGLRRMPSRILDAGLVMRDDAARSLGHRRMHAFGESGKYGIPDKLL